MNSNKKLLFQLNHPAHYHLFKNAISILREKGHDVHISIKVKDMLKDLLAGQNFHVISDKYRKKNIYSITKNVLKRDIKFLKLVKTIKPDIMIGTSPEIAHVRKFCKTPSIFFGEDDVTISKMMYWVALTSYPFFDSIVSPEGCNNDKWNMKTTFYKGFQKLAYLHPNWFIPDRSKVEISQDKRYFLLRFSRFAAYHDLNAEGIGDDLAAKLISHLEPYGEILISSERELPNKFDKYRFRGKLHDIHHYIFFAEIFIGDSQSMAVEAAVLGTPSIRFNNFVGKISVLEELERKYGLTFGISSNEPRKLFEKINEIIANPNSKIYFESKRQKMLAEKIDVTAFMVWFIENYPESTQIMKRNPEIQFNFK